MNKKMIEKIVEAHDLAVGHWTVALTSKEREQYNTEAATYEKILDMFEVSYERDDFGFIHLTK